MSIELLSKASWNRVYGKTLCHIDLSAIRSHPSPIRKDLSEEGIAELSESIYHVGLLHPILIKESGGHYEIVSGERRFRAYQLLNDRYPDDFSEIPSILIDSNMDTRVFSLSENIHREPLTILEECETIYSLIETVKDTYGGIGKLLGKSEDYIENRMRYLRIHNALKSRIASFQLAPTFYEKFDGLGLSKVLTLKPLLSHWSEEESCEFLQEIVEGDMSLREIKARLCDHQKKISERRETIVPQSSSNPEGLVERPLKVENRDRSTLREVLATQVPEKQVYKPLNIDGDFWSTLMDMIETRLNRRIHDIEAFQGAMRGLIQQYGEMLD
mgnify:CR=1 FL=1